MIPPGLAYLADNIITKGNLLGAARGRGAEWAKDLNLPKEGETIFFAGCGHQYASELESLSSLIRRIDKSAVGTDMAFGLASFQKKVGLDVTRLYSRVAAGRGNSGAEVLRDAVKVLSRLGLKFGYLAEDEPCCGGPLHYIGLRQQFTEQAQKAHDRFKSKGVKRIISLVPSCTYTLRQLMANNVQNYDLEVKHFVEVVAENLSSLKLRFPREVKVTYHDPCQLVRFLNLTEEPRRILKAIKGVELVEPEWTKVEYATCCGGGGGFEAVFPELSEILAVNRARELVATGAEIIITPCPGCIMQLKAGLKGLKASNIAVLDMTQIVAMSMEG